MPSLTYTVVLLTGVSKAPSAMMPWVTPFLLGLLLHCCLGHNVLTGAPRIYLTYKGKEGSGGSHVIANRGQECGISDSCRVVLV